MKKTRRQACRAIVAPVIAAILCAIFVPNTAAQTRRGSALVFLVRPRGITPNQVTVRAGRISITVISKTGHSRTDFRILPARAGAGIQDTVGTARIDLGERRQTKASTAVELAPGEYRLVIDGRSNVSCLITVVP